MKNYNFLKLIETFRCGEMDAFVEVYDLFKDLIKYYSIKTNDEDFAEELTVFLLELLYDIDLKKFRPDNSDGLHRYISVAIRNKYIALSKKNQVYCQTEKKFCENDFLCTNNPDSAFFIKECLKLLPVRQRTVILYRYVYCYSDAEIALLLNISRQAVSRLRTRALNTLREYFI